MRAQRLTRPQPSAQQTAPAIPAPAQAPAGPFPPWRTRIAPQMDAYGGLGVVLLQYLQQARQALTGTTGGINVDVQGNIHGSLANKKHSIVGSTASAISMGSELSGMSAGLASQAAVLPAAWPPDPGQPQSAGIMLACLSLAHPRAATASPSHGPTGARGPAGPWFSLPAASLAGWPVPVVRHKRTAVMNFSTRKEPPCLLLCTSRQRVTPVRLFLFFLVWPTGHWVPCWRGWLPCSGRAILWLAGRCTTALPHCTWPLAAGAWR